MGRSALLIPSHQGVRGIRAMSLAMVTRSRGEGAAGQLSPLWSDCFSFPYSHSLEACQKVQPTLKRWGFQNPPPGEGISIRNKWDSPKGKFVSSPPFIYLPSRLYQYRLADVNFISFYFFNDIYFRLRVIIQCYLICFLAHIVPAMAPGSSFS